MVTFRAVAADEPAARIQLSEYFSSRALGFAGGLSYTTVFPKRSDFEPPQGVFLLVLSAENEPIGCGGIRQIDAGDTTGIRFEVKHLWLNEGTRGKGYGRALLTELETRAREFGATELVLDTNASLTEAAGLYRSSGFADIEPYNENPNATNWYAKALR
jgi:ribosomal protein S18 acetylase RimI-like enzyme